MERFQKKLLTISLKIVGGVLFVLMLALLFAYVTMLLWNWLMPVIFGLPVIGYWQAWGLLVLAKILFGSGSHHRGHRQKRDGGDREQSRSWGKAKLKRWVQREIDREGKLQPAADSADS